MLLFTGKRERSPIVTWVAFGAGLMYLLDPAQGGRRRALVRDKVTHVAHVVRSGARRAKWDLTNRAHGLGARLHAKPRTQEPVSDEVLAERVRSKLGVFVSHPRAVEVRVDGGVVTLSGLILQREAKAFARYVKCMAGVRQLVDHLERHRKRDHVPSLQGGVARRRRAELFQRTWAPGLQLLAGAAGIGLIGIGIGKRYAPLAALGAAVLLRASMNVPFGRMLQTAQSRALRGPDADNSVAATAPIPGSGSSSLLEPTPSERADEVARSIRE